MKITIAALLAIATASTASAWSLIPSPLWDFDQSTSNMIRRHRELANRMMERTDQLMQQQTGQLMQSSPFPTSPRYEIINDKDRFQVSLDVPGVLPENMNIDLDEDGYLTISGERMAKTDTAQYSSRFSQTFLLDPTVDVDSFSANLDDGVLKIEAVKNPELASEKVRKIPILSTSGEERFTPSNTLKASASDVPEKEQEAPTTSSDRKIEIQTHEKADAEPVMNLDTA